MTRILSLEKEYDVAFAEAAALLRKGGVLIYPTDTVYGIGGDARDLKVVERVRKIKGKKEQVFSVILGGVGMVGEYAVTEGKAMQYVLESFPGATTLLLKSKKELPVVRVGKIGVRVPEHIFMRRLSLELGMPIITTSANRSGETAPTDFAEIEKSVMEEADLAIDGGKTLHGMSSTVVDVEEEKVLRSGAGRIPFTELAGEY
ncbi:threonylcarbamoyl-AMP synthase [Candidatus Micrarchaeota archaeon]|nr:threonylcarbamoyl-AMP synthase [Candidatus Micrarchaeota archaeon]